MENRKRSLIKGITYRLMATIATFSLAYIFTGSLEIASQIGLLDFVLKYIIYYANERVWTRTSWGYSAKEKKQSIPLTVIRSIVSHLPASHHKTEKRSFSRLREDKKSTPEKLTKEAHKKIIDILASLKKIEKMVEKTKENIFSKVLKRVFAK